MPRSVSNIVLSALCLTGVACTQNVQVETTFPEPLVEPLPVTVGIHYTEELTQYSYSEELPEDSTDWNFNIGSANQLLFESIFSEVFTGAIPVSGRAADGVVAVLEPGIEAFEFSLPRHSRSDQYGVWINYTLNVYGPDGELRANWPVKGYGEVDSRRFKGNETMKHATVLAMRDAATIIIDSLDRDTGLRRAILGEYGASGGQAASSAAESVDTITLKGPTDDTPEIGRADEAVPELAGEERNGES